MVLSCLIFVTATLKTIIFQGMKDSIIPLLRSKSILIFTAITTIILLLINVPNYRLSSTVTSNVILSQQVHVDSSQDDIRPAQLEDINSSLEIKTLIPPSISPTSVVSYEAGEDVVSNDGNRTPSSLFVDMTIPTNDNLHLRPPNQTWARSQMDKVFSMLGYTYDPPNNWHHCTHSRQTYMFEKINTIFTGVPKSGCSHWIEALLQAAGTLKEPLARDKLFKVHGALSSRHRMSSSHNQHLNIHEKFSFVVIRNPWTRMVSGYLDKLSGEPSPGHDKKALGRAIVNEMREVTDTPELNESYPTFEEFLRWLLQHKGSTNVHFMPQNKILCIPSSMYDFVVPLENSDTLNSLIWSKIHSTSHLQGSYDSAADPRKQSSAQRAREWFLKIDKAIIDRLYDLYKVDFVLLNYSNFTDPDFPLPIHER